MEVLSSMSHPVAAGGEPGREDTDDASDRRLTEEEDDQTLFLFLFFDASFPCSVMLLYICLPPIWAMVMGRVLHYRPAKMLLVPKQHHAFAQHTRPLVIFSLPSSLKNLCTHAVMISLIKLLILGSQCRMILKIIKSK
jgi:hypothetical protein